MAYKSIWLWIYHRSVAAGVGRYLSQNYRLYDTFRRCEASLKTASFGGIKHFLGGGNSDIFYFHPDPWGNDPIWRAYIFQMGWFNHQLVLNHLRVIFGDLFCPPVFCWGFWFLTRLTDPASQVTQSFEWAASVRLSKLGVPKKIGLESQLAHGIVPKNQLVESGRRFGLVSNLRGIIPSFGNCSHTQFHVYWIHCLSMHPLILGPGLEGPSYSLWICKKSLRSALNWLYSIMYAIIQEVMHHPCPCWAFPSSWGNHRICLAPSYPTWARSSFRRCSA